MVERLLRRLTDAVLTHKIWVVVVVMAITLGFASVLPSAVLGSSVRSLFFGDDHPGYNAYLAKTAEFGTDEIYVFGVEAEAPLDSTLIGQLRDFEARVSQMPEVLRVVSIVNLERVGLEGDTIGVRNFGDEVLADPSSSAQILEEIRGDPIAGELLVGRGGSDTLVLVEMAADPNRDAEDGPRYLAQMLAAFEAAGLAREKIHPGGGPTVIAEMIQQSQLNILQLFPMVSLLLLLAVFVMFGRLWPVVVTTVSALVAVIWATSFAVAMDPTVNVLMSILPVFVMIISFSDVVHICSAYLLNLDAGHEKREAIVAATAEVGAACLLTSLTTGVGFLALAWVPAPAFSRLGLASAFGVVAAYVLALVLVPVMLDVLPTPGSWKEGRAAAVQARVEEGLAAVASFTIARYRLLIAAFAVLLAVMAFGASKIEIETTFSERLDDQNVVRVDQRWLQDRFVDSVVLDVYVDAGGEGALLDAETFAALAEFERRLEAREGVEKVVSLVDLMQATHRSVVGEDADFSRTDDAQIAQLMVLLEMQGPDALKSYVDFGRREARFTVHTSIHGIVGQNELRTFAEREGEKLLGEADILATGLGPLMGEWLTEILAGQKRGLLFSLIVIGLILMFAFRSFTAGAVSMIPNVIPLLFAAAFAGFAWETTDSDTLVVGMIALGIGVDDTIHFIARYATEVRRTGDRDAAIRETFRYSGRGIVITTFVFTAGFLPLLVSDYLSIWVMGLLLPICFVVALVADLLLVPALIRAGWLRV